MWGDFTFIMVFCVGSLLQKLITKTIYMKKLGKQKNKKKFILKILLGFIIGISFGFGIGKMIKSNSRLGGSIEKSLQQNCNCESVTLDGSAVGIQFNKVDGLSNSTFDFTLKNCEYSASAKKEANRLNTILKREIENYDSVDFISFHFKTKNKIESVKIKNEK